jgi:glucose-1-phosphate cytidylyltransferase
MKVGILAGGAGTRFPEETDRRPKPMVEVGGRPLLWHIMKHYARHGFADFVIALGYRGDVIKRYFVDSVALQGDFTIRTRDGHIERHRAEAPEDWSVTLVETGLTTATGGRIRRLAPFLGPQTFMLTWGDGVSNVDLVKLLDFHRSHGRLATVTAVRAPARFGSLELDDDTVLAFREKPPGSGGWINGAFFVLEPGVFEYVDGDDTPWEREPLERLARDGQLMAFRHDDYWQCMDTLDDWRRLQRLWDLGAAPWKTWS